MRLLTPFDLVSRFEMDKSLVIVGNAPSLRESGLGSWIDGHDVVVRFNGCAVKGYEQDVGSRTDILVANPYTETFHRAPGDGLAVGMILVIARQTRRGDKAQFTEWAGDHDILFTYNPEIHGLETNARSSGVTTGIYAVSLLRRVLRPNRLAVTGFTLFQDETAHYWSDQMPAGVTKHDLLRDAELLVELVNTSKGRVEVTSEIRWLSRRVGRPLGERVKVRALPDPKWTGESNGP